MLKKTFHVVYTLLALNFLIPVAIYVAAPALAVDQFAEVGALLGGGSYPHTEDSVLWRVLAIANVATLGFCCVVLQIDLERYFAVLLPLAFLKGAASIGFLVAFLFEPYPAYLAASLFDAITVATFITFAVLARREVRAKRAEARAVESPRAPKRDSLEILFAAIVPGWRGSPLPPAFPLHVRIALRLSVWVASVLALLRYGRGFSRLDDDRREALLDHMAHHDHAPLRSLVAWWKLVAMVTRC